MVPLSRAIGRKRALDMLLTGTPVDAATALDWGLVNRVVPAQMLDEAVREFTDAILAASPLTVRLGKEAFYRTLHLGEPEAYALATDVMTANAKTRDAQEGMAAFLQKRPPVWRGE